MNSMDLWEKVRAVPPTALKTIGGGRLKGMSDINPVFRIKLLTEIFGTVGLGWYYDITKQWQEPVDSGEIAVFTNINLFVKDKEEWSKPIQGTGGSLLVAMEKEGLHTNDECFKMALTDAISVACKAIGIGADVYWQKDNTKYTRWDDGQQPQPPTGQKPLAATDRAVNAIADGQPAAGKAGEKYYGAMALAFKTGKHAGQTIGELTETKDGMQYLEWYQANGKNPFMQGKITEAAEELAKRRSNVVQQAMANVASEPSAAQGEMPFNLNADDEDLPF